MKWMSKLETVRAGSICDGLRQIIFYDHGHFSKMTPTYVKEHQTKMLCPLLGNRSSRSGSRKREEWINWLHKNMHFPSTPVWLKWFLSFLSCLCELFLTMIPLRIPPSHARMQQWLLKGATSSRLSAWRTTPGGRPVTSGTETLGQGSFPHSSSMRGCHYMLFSQ